MTPLEKTIVKIMGWDPYHSPRNSQRFVNRMACASGVVVIDYIICRGIEPCPICGQMTGMGTVAVRHRDGRVAGFHPRLYHYVDAQHPITEEDVDGQLLLAIMADAEDWPSRPHESQNNLARLETEAVYLGVLTARELKPLSRLEYVVGSDILTAMFQHLDLTVTSVARVAQNGERIAHWILARGYLSRTPSPIEQYVKKFDGTSLTSGAPSVIQAEARFFGYPDCCAEAYIRDPNFVPDFGNEDLSLLFHRPCRGCKATRELLPGYRAAFTEARSLYEALRPHSAST